MAQILTPRNRHPTRPKQRDVHNLHKHYVDFYGTIKGGGEFHLAVPRHNFLHPLSHPTPRWTLLGAKVAQAGSRGQFPRAVNRRVAVRGRGGGPRTR